MEAIRLLGKQLCRSVLCELPFPASIAQMEAPGIGARELAKRSFPRVVDLGQSKIEALMPGRDRYLRLLEDHTSESALSPRFVPNLKTFQCCTQAATARVVRLELVCSPSPASTTTAQLLKQNRNDAELRRSNSAWFGGEKAALMRHRTSRRECRGASPCRRDCPGSPCPGSA
jgi:hypothetical protein